MTSQGYQKHLIEEEGEVEIKTMTMLIMAYTGAQENVNNCEHQQRNSEKRWI